MALLGGCQPLPHPFEDDRPPAALLKIRDTAGVSIAPIVGGPEQVIAKLAPATAAALLKRDIPATDKTAGLGSYLLYGRAVSSRPRNDKMTLTLLWRLYDPKGHAVGERSVKAEEKTGDWAAANDAAVARLAAMSAEALAPLLADEGPAAAPQPAEGGGVRVAIGKIGGAPGDGAKSLAAALVAVLKRQDITIVEDGAKADLNVEGEIALTPVKPDKQNIKILWRVRRPDGAEIGTVGQENEIPRGLLDGPWGDVAYNVAISAREGLVQLISRGAQAPKS